MAFAGHVATAVENARLFERVEQRTRELSALVDISRSVSSTLELGNLVDIILDQLKTVVACDAASVTVVEDEHATLLALHNGELRMKLPAGTQQLKDLPSGERIVRSRKALLLYDTDQDQAMSRWLREETKDFPADLSEIRSFLGVPLITRDEVIGWVSVGHKDVDHFSEQDIELTQAFANQVAVAISNARFHEQAQDLAVIEERQRIARDLHDSVSQALYSILLTSSAARTLADRRPDAVAGPLDTVVSLAEGGLAEMRALIFELRPESLEQEGLVVAIEKRVAALRTRHSLEVALSLCEEPELKRPCRASLRRHCTTS
jgi:signal transduction histidine kinase